VCEILAQNVDKWKKREKEIQNKLKRFFHRFLLNIGINGFYTPTYLGEAFF